MVCLGEDEEAVLAASFEPLGGMAVHARLAGAVFGRALEDRQLPECPGGLAVGEAPQRRRRARCRGRVVAGHKAVAADRWVIESLEGEVERVWSCWGGGVERWGVRCGKLIGREIHEKQTFYKIYGAPDFWIFVTSINDG